MLTINYHMFVSSMRRANPPKGLTRLDSGRDVPPQLPRTHLLTSHPLQSTTLDCQYFSCSMGHEAMRAYHGFTAVNVKYSITPPLSLFSVFP
jgi:hypothetical protein